MPWTPLPRIAFAIAIHPFNPTTRDDLPLELGDELYIIESCSDGEWFRGYLVAPPSLLAGLTSTKGATLEARVFSGIFPAACVDIKEYLTTEVPGVHPEDAAEGASEYEYDEESHRGSMVLNGFYGEMNGANGKGSRPLSYRSTKPTRTKSSRSRRKHHSFVGVNQGGSNADRPRPAAPVPMLKVGDETSSFESEPLVDEIASCLREWHAANLHELLLGRQYPLLDQISTLVHQLDLSRRQLLHDVLTKSERAMTREKTVWALVKGNKLLSREIIVRDPTSGRILTGEDSSVEITTLQSQMSLLEEPPQPPNDGITLHHLLLQHKAFVGMTNEPTTLVFYLANKSNIAISEPFAVELSAQGVPADETQMQTLFTDLSSRDASEEMYLIARVYTSVTIQAGGLTVSAKGQTLSSEPSFGTVKQHKHNNTNGHKNPNSPAKENQKMKGRVSVLFSPRPRTGGKDTNGESRPHHGNETVISAGRYDDHRPLSSSDSIPSVPSINVPCVQPKKVTFNRALGVGVLDVGRFVKQEQGTEQIMRIFVPPGAGINSTDKGGGAGDKGGGKGHEGEDWDRFIRDLIDSRTSKFEKSPKADRLHLYLRPFASADAETLIRLTPTLLHDISCTQKIGFSGAPTKPRSDIYITLCNPILPRHALLLHPKSGSCPIPPNSQFNALQISLEVRRPSGEMVKDCVFSSSNTPGKTIWRSVVIARDESWSETIKLVLNEEDVPKVHVFMTVCSVPHAPVALAWLPLWENDAFVRDGDHTLLLHRHDDNTASLPTSSDGGGYLSQPWTAGDEVWNSASTIAAAGLKVKTYLCSTKFSEDDTVLSLLKWKSISQEQLAVVLKKLVFVPEMEIVKLLREVFDALFGVLVDHAKKQDIEDLVFNALVTVLGIVHDRRFHLEPIVDEYAEKFFDYPFSTPCLLRSFTRLLQDPTNPESSKRLRATFKVGRHVFRFIVHAREKQIVKEATIGINGNQTFAKDLQGIFKLLENLMRNPAPALVGSQTLAVQHFHLWLPELVGVLTREEIFLIAIDFMDACSSVKNKLVLYKLVLIVNYSRSSLFSQPEDRRALTLNTVRWLAPHWGNTEDVTAQWREQVRLCCSVLASQIEELGEEVSEYIPKIIDSYRAIQATGRHERETFSLLFPRTYPFPSKPILDRPVFDEALIELSAILAAVSNIPTGLHLDLVEDELAQFLMDDLRVHMSILSCEAFPESWLSVHIYQHKSTMRTLETLAGILVDSFLPDPDDAENFNTELWQAFFTTLLMLVGSDALALETFPEQKRRAVWKVAGDVREQGADLLRRTWEAIGWETSPDDKRRFGVEKMGGYQVQYVPGLVAPIVELCLSVHEGLRSVAVEVLQTMVVSEWTLSEDLSVIQAEMIDSLDRLFKSKRLTESITQKLFIADLIELFQPLSLIPNDPLTIKVRDLLHTVDEFLDLLVAVHNTPLGEAYHIMDTLRLMDFLKDMRKEDMFIRYVHQLVDVQLESSNYVEAGLSLGLHADLYSWNTSEIVPALISPSFPEQTSFERRETLCLEMIKLFEDGKSWENALDMYKEIADQYEHVVFDYNKLSKCHRAMAKIHNNVLDGDRFSPQFFRVAYLGMGFPLGLRDRQFVIQGNHGEKLAVFTDRIQQQHPSAKIVASGDVDSVEGQFIHITAVYPEHDLLHPVWQRGRIAPSTRDFLLNKRPRAFYYSRPVQGCDPNKVTDFWAEKTVYSTSESFPTILKRSEVVSVSTARVSPIENAIEAVAKKTFELAVLEKKFAESKSGDATNVSPLSMGITGAVDGGVARYREFLEDDNLQEELRGALRTAILDHVAMLKKCLGVHGRLVSQQLRPMHENMMRFFERNFGAEIVALTPTPQPVQVPVSPGQWRSTLYLPGGQLTPIPISSKTNHMAPPIRVVNGSNRMSTVPTLPPPTADTFGDNHSMAGSHRSRLSAVFDRKPGKDILARTNSHKNTGKSSSVTGGRESRSGSTSTAASRANSTSRGRSTFSRHKRPVLNNITDDQYNSNGNIKKSNGMSNGYGGEHRQNEVGKDGEAEEDDYYDDDGLSNFTRPSTSSTRPPGSAGSGIVERGVGSVRKRFSMLKLGRKTSRGSAVGGGIMEE